MKKLTTCWHAWPTSAGAKVNSALTRAEKEAALLLMGFESDEARTLPRTTFSHPRCVGWIKLYLDGDGGPGYELMMSSGVRDKLGTPYVAGESNWISFDQFIERWAKYLEALDGQ